MAQRTGKHSGAIGDERAWHSLDDGWMDAGVCRTDPEVEARWFFPDAPYSSLEAKFRILSAKQCCQRCPMQVTCLTYAQEGGLMGIWGGTTDEERRRMVGKTRVRSRR